VEGIRMRRSDALCLITYSPKIGSFPRCSTRIRTWTGPATTNSRWARCWTI
jgi:hypothetical protein